MMTTISRAMILALADVLDAPVRLGVRRIHAGTLQALERRGLVARAVSRRNGDCYLTITPMGELVISAYLLGAETARAAQ